MERSISRPLLLWDPISFYFLVFTADPASSQISFEIEGAVYFRPRRSTAQHPFKRLGSTGVFLLLHPHHLSPAALSLIAPLVPFSSSSLLRPTNRPRVCVGRTQAVRFHRHARARWERVSNVLHFTSSFPPIFHSESRHSRWVYLLLTLCQETDQVGFPSFSNHI